MLVLTRDVHGGAAAAAVAVAAWQFIFHNRRGAAAADVQPRWTSLVLSQ